MNGLNDQELLRDYAGRRSESAFAELVRRHIDLVYSAALRMVRDAHLAEDVTQAVFVALAQKARQLTDRPVLSGWLHRTAQNLAANTVRSEVRRRAREQEAAAMNEPQEPDAIWEQIAPQLDAVLGELSDADRDAVLLRYFERKSAREMAQILGTSEEAAQKRVSRAVERLRECLVQRGVTVGASGLVVAVSANAVQAAPVGLSATVTTAATAAIGLSDIAQPAVATTKTTLIAAVLVAALSIPLVLFWQQNKSLRRELAIRRSAASQAMRPAETDTEPREAKGSADERQRLRLEHLELLSLRGRVTQLASELRQLRSAAMAGTSTNPAPEPAEADSILFSVALTNRVVSGHTLVVGGWSKDDMRGYLLVTPVILSSNRGPESEQLTVQSQIVGAPESFWTRIGWGGAKSETRRSTLASVLTPAQCETLLQALRETKDAELSNTSLAKRRDGEYVGMGWGINGDNAAGMLGGIDVYPWIAPDGQAVDLEIRPSPVSSNMQIHPILKAGLPPAR